MLMRRLAVFSFALVSLSILVNPVLAQETTGNLEGRLVDAEGKPIAFANVNFTSPNLQGGRGVMSTSDGYFGIFKLPVGVYKVKISHVSYHDVTYENVSIRLGRTTTLGRITLTSKIFEAPAIVVTEKKSLIDPNSTAIGATLTTEEFRELPIDRNYKNITTLLPHANESFFGDETNFGGATGQENKYFIDGAETTDPYLGLTGTNLPYNFVQDIEVRAGGYEAEYRSSLGGIMNVVSRSGGNEFHGQVFGFFVNNQFEGSTRHGVTEPEIGDFAQYDMGISLGGPIKKDKLWFFGAYNPSFSEEDVEIPGTGFHTDKSTRHSFAGKLDWRVTDRTNVTFTATGDPTVRDGVGATFGGVGVATNFEEPDPFLVDVETGGVNLLARATHMFNDNFFLEASSSRIERTTRFQGATETGRSEQLFIDEETGTWSGGYPTPVDDKSVQWTSDITGTYILGSHMLKSGLEYRDNRLDFDEEWIVLHRVSDSSFVEVYWKSSEARVRNRIPSAFIQDSWRVTERLRINAGLRWDGQFIVGSDGDVAQKITSQYQPRAGFIYQPGELGTQKIFGSFGRYYQELPLAIAVNKLNEGVVFTITAWDHDPRVDPSGGNTWLEQRSEIQAEVEDLEGQHFDEFVLGYERQLGRTLTVGARGVYRTLREGIEDGFSEALGHGVYGNPGSGDLSEFPEMERDYRALELSVRTFGGARYQARASYVLSRNEGNYPGLFTPEAWMIPNVGPFFDRVEGTVNSNGKLPNDRTHVFKLSGSYRVGYGLSAGTSFMWMTGTPLSVLEGSSDGPPFLNFAQERGSAGRTPDIWDLNLRFVYEMNYLMDTTVQPRLILDIFHLGSQREPVMYDEVKNFEQDDSGNQISPNPSFGAVQAYQPPTSVRLGVEVDF